VRPPTGRAGLRLRRLAPAVLAAAALAGALVALTTPGASPRLPPAGIRQPLSGGDPFAYNPGRSSDFSARAIAGEAHPLFALSPGGVVATAARVAAWRRLIDAATAGTSIDPRVLEGIVFLESAGRSQVIAGDDPAAAAGLTQIVAQTGRALLGMHIDLSSSRRLTRAIERAQALGQVGRAARLEAARARADDRFDPARALAAAVRYLQLARAHFGREDLAVESYHMGIGNLQSVLDAYDGGRPVPYVQLYFDTAPDHHAGAYALLSSFGDDSWTYWWRVLAAVEIMRLYRFDRPALERLVALQTDAASAAEVLHPPDRTAAFADPGAVAKAYADRTLVPLPRNAAALGLSYSPAFVTLARRLGSPAALYRGLRRPALDLLVELAARVRTLAGGAQPLIVTGAVVDERDQRRLGIDDPPAAAGWSFELARSYVSRRQRAALQAMLDRLQSLNLIAWERYPGEIEVTVASDADRVIAHGV
jgi:hypothetical protein